MLGHPSIEKATKIYERKHKTRNPEEVAKQYCEFMCLKILSGGFSASAAQLSPGGEIDAFWHIHVLDTLGYRYVLLCSVSILSTMVYY
jgi:hypothetical protein